MSDIRFNNWKHQSGTGGVTQNSGGNVGIGSTLPSSKLDVGGDVQVTGVVTATAFHGSGANLTSLPAANLTGTLPAISGANLTGINTAFGSGTSVNSTGIATFSQVETLDGTSFLKKHSVGIGTTTTAGRNAGVSTATGELIFNSTNGRVQVYTGNLWLDLVSTFSATGGSTSTVSGYKYHTFTSSGAFVVSSGQVSIDSLVVAGGGGGSGGSGNSGGLHGGGGGAGGMIASANVIISPGTYPVTIGAGGACNANGDNSVFNGNTAIGGGKGASEGSGPTRAAGNGGSGGGATYNASFGTGTAGQGNPGGQGAGGGNYATGGGGGAGAVGGSAPNNANAGNGGAGSAWLNGTTYAGGGGGCHSTVSTPPGGSSGSGGSGGGGNGSSNGTNPGTTNTGGGGGASDRPAIGGSGGPGIVIIRYESN